MSEQCIGIALAVAGGLAEIGGLALLAVGIWKDRKKARALFGNIVVKLGAARAYGRGGSLTARLEGGHEPPVAERLDQLEARIGELSKRVDDELFEQRKRTDKQVDEAVEKAQKHTDEVRDELREHLADVLAGSVTARVVGAMLFAVGVGLSVAANIVLA